MPLLYLAKVNLNSNIFDIYNKSLKIKDVSNLIYEKFDIGNNFNDKSKEKYTDSLGNLVEYYRESSYSFQEIQKYNDGTITGKLVRSFNKPSEDFDKITNKMVASYVKERVSIFFYFDVYKEMITFCERQSFGYNQFMRAFTYLLNNCASPYEFEIFLQKDKDLLEEKLKTLQAVQRVSATLIPPNSNEKDLEELRQELLYMQQCKEANAIKLNLEYSSNNMNMESKVMRDIKTAVSRGYGDVNATGINFSGRRQTVRSSQDAAYTSNIRKNINEDDFKEESQNLIFRFLSKLSNKVFSWNGDAKVND